MQQLRFGDITVDRIVEAEGLGFPPEFLLPDSDIDVIRDYRDWLEPHFFDPESGRFIQSVHCYVVRSPRHTVLIDTCVGNDKQRPSTRAWNGLDTDFLDRLRDIGVTPADVDYVLCTHLHVDHVGWNTRLLDGRWVPTFPNARYLFHQTEFDYWENNGDYVVAGPGASDGFYEDSVLPVVAAGQAVFVADGHTIDDWLTVESWPGHSPGHVCLRLESGWPRGRVRRRPAAPSGAMPAPGLEQPLLLGSGHVRRLAPALRRASCRIAGDYPRRPFRHPGRRPDRRAGRVDAICDAVGRRRSIAGSAPRNAPDQDPGFFRMAVPRYGAQTRLLGMRRFTKFPHPE